MSQMLKSSGAMAAATMTSRILGMAREIVYSWFMGVEWVAGAFQLAFLIPNLFRRLLGEGALTASFIPIFKEKERTSNEAEMWRAANAVISGLLVSASLVVVLAIAGISVALAVHVFDQQTQLMLRLLRVMFPYMLMVCLAAICMGMLNARGHFFIPATGTGVMNIVLIASVFLLAPKIGHTLKEQIFGIAVGVLLAGIAQVLFQIPTLQAEGFRYRWVNPWGDPTVKRVVKQMIPGTIGVAAFQINVVLTQSVAFWVDPTIVASFNYAVRLMELPQGVFGVSLATYLLPTLSGLAAEKKYDEFRDTLHHGLDHLVFVNLIASILLVLLAEPIVRLLFEHGKFGAVATVQVGQALECLAPGLVLFSIVNVLARAFYALGDTKTPMVISVVCLVINLVFSICLVTPLRQRGLGIANTVTAAINVSCLLFALRKKMGRLGLASLKDMLVYMVGAAVIGGLAAWGVSHWWIGTFGTAGLLPRAGAVFVPMAIAGAIYWGITLQFKVLPAMEISGLLLQKFRKKAG